MNIPQIAKEALAPLHKITLAKRISERAMPRGAKNRRRQAQRATGGVFWARKKSKTTNDCCKNLKSCLVSPQPACFCITGGMFNNLFLFPNVDWLLVDYSVEVQLTLFTKHHFSACGICPHFISGIYPTADIITCRGKLCFPLQPSTHWMYNSQGCHGFYMTGYGFVVGCLGFLSHSQNLVCRPLGLSAPWRIHN